MTKLDKNKIENVDGSINDGFVCEVSMLANIKQ